MKRRRARRTFSLAADVKKVENKIEATTVNTKQHSLVSQLPTVHNNHVLTSTVTNKTTRQTIIAKSD